MKVLVRNHGDGGASVEVIDPSDGMVTHQAILKEGEQATVVATSAHSPADIEFGEVEAIPVADPEPEAEQAEAGEPEAEAPEGGDPQGEAPVGDSPGQAEGTDTPEGEDGESAAA